MGTGIMVCGLNGSGKSTLGRKLAEKLNFYFMDNEDLFFPKTDPAYLFASPRTREEVEKLLMQEVRVHENFVFAAVKGDYGKEILSHYQFVVLIEVPKEIRIARVKNRSFHKFGNRMLPGGDLFAEEEAFFKMMDSRPENYVEAWVQTLNCPVIRVDGRKEIDENVAFIIERMQGE